MNWLKRNLVSLTLVFAFLVLLGFIVWLLRGAMRDEKEWRTKYADLKAELEGTTQLHGKRYPSPENRGILDENLKLLQRVEGDLVTQIRKRAVKYEAEDGFSFHTKASNRVQALLDEVTRRQVQIPPVFGFGFYYYYRGAIAHRDNTPLLQQQLDAVESVVKVLLDARVHAIDEILVVEPTGENVPKGNIGPLGTPPPPEVLNLNIIERKESTYTYRLIPYQFRFRCSTEALRQILNKLTEQPYFFEVASLEIATERVGPLSVTPVDPAPTSPGEFLYGEDRQFVRLVIYQVDL
jgi:hypothetical protein